MTCSCGSNRTDSTTCEVVITVTSVDDLDPEAAKLEELERSIVESNRVGWSRVRSSGFSAGTEYHGELITINRLARPPPEDCRRRSIVKSPAPFLYFVTNLWRDEMTSEERKRMVEEIGRKADKMMESACRFDRLRFLAERPNASAPFIIVTLAAGRLLDQQLGQTADLLEILFHLKGSEDNEPK